MPNLPPTPRGRRQPPSSPVVARIDEACRRVVDGKHAAREVAQWVAANGIGETEFRLLWVLFDAGDSDRLIHDIAPDQAELAARLAVSAAQVSGAVERLHAGGHIEKALDAADRRRQLWRLAPAGRALVYTILQAVAAATGKEAA